VSVDLNNPDVRPLEALWHELRRRHEARSASPGLRADLERALAQAYKDGRLSAEDTDRIRRELDDNCPAAVLAGNWQEVVANRPALGAFVQGPLGPDSFDSDEWLREDPARLASIVSELRAFNGDVDVVAASALAIADRAGIDENAADEAVASALGTVQRAG
jgi:hypothetical protein